MVVNHSAVSGIPCRPRLSFINRTTVVDVWADNILAEPFFCRRLYRTHCLPGLADLLNVTQVVEKRYIYVVLVRRRVTIATTTTTTVAGRHARSATIAVLCTYRHRCIMRVLILSYILHCSILRAINRSSHALNDDRFRPGAGWKEKIYTYHGA